MSLCDFKYIKSMDNNNKFRVIFFIQNPIISYIKEDSAGSYIQSRNNIVTRSITCKSNNELLTYDDIMTTKRFLYNSCEIGTTNNNYNFIQMLIDRYNWKLKEEEESRNDNACGEHFKECLDRMNLHYYTSTLNNNDELLDLFKEFNSEDFNIYNELNPLV